jgi:cyclopropane fatty-acyl-phospholipid synthase-like methyltransferase
MDHAKFSTIAHRNHAYCNPLDPARLDQVTDLLDLTPGRRVLDVGCGKGSLLVRIAERHGASGTGIDINAAFLAEGRAAAARRGVASRVELLEVEASRFAAAPGSFDVGICVGSTHAFGSYRATLRGLARLVRPGGSVLVGEGYWRRDPDPEYLRRLGTTSDEMTTHQGTLAAGTQEGLAPRGAWVSSDRDWDGYEDLYARTVETYVATHPEDPDTAAMRERIRWWRETYLRWGRDTLGFGLYLFKRL